LALLAERHAGGGGALERGSLRLGGRRFRRAGFSRGGGRAPDGGAAGLLALLAQRRAGLGGLLEHLGLGRCLLVGALRRVGGLVLARRRLARRLLARRRRVGRLVGRRLLAVAAV